MKLKLSLINTVYSPAGKFSITLESPSHIVQAILIRRSTSRCSSGNSGTIFYESTISMIVVNSAVSSIAEGSSSEVLLIVSKHRSVMLPPFRSISVPKEKDFTLAEPGCSPGNIYTGPTKSAVLCIFVKRVKHAYTFGFSYILILGEPVKKHSERK